MPSWIMLFISCISRVEKDVFSVVLVANPVRAHELLNTFCTCILVQHVIIVFSVGLHRAATRLFLGVNAFGTNRAKFRRLSWHFHLALGHKQGTYHGVVSEPQDLVLLSAKHSGWTLDLITKVLKLLRLQTDEYANLPFVLSVSSLSKKRLC
jgi:hypothetical protein